MAGGSAETRGGEGAQRLDRLTTNFTRLRYFVAVAEELHFGRAAARLGISQPPLTKNIQALEAAYGTALLLRTKRSVKLTPSGQVLLDEARSLLAHADRVTQTMHGAASGNLSKLFLGSVPFALLGIVPDIVQSFRRQAPFVNIVLSEGHTAAVIAGVLNGSIDFGIVWKNHGVAEFEECPVVTGGFMAVLPPGHRLVEKPAIMLRDLAGEPLILPSRKHSPFQHDQLIAALVNAGVTPQIDYEIPTILSQIGFAAGGFGIALVPDVARGLETFGVAFRPIVEVRLDYKLVLVWLGERLSEPGRSFLGLVRGYAGEEGKPGPDGTAEARRKCARPGRRSTSRNS